MGIAAVPGAGKTTIIQHLVIKLITKDGVPADRIGVGTYMRSAQSYLASKFAAYGRVRVFTLHSLSLQILQEVHPGGFSFNVLESYQRERMLNELVATWLDRYREVWQTWQLSPEDKQPERIRAGLNKATDAFISKAKQRRLRPYQISAPSGSPLAVAVELYDRYQHSLEEQQLLDYDDMVVKAVQLLTENRYIGRVAQNWFDYLLEDEAQDSSPLQAYMLDILSARSGNLIKVGDPNQCIMSTFTNSDPHLFRSFCQKYQRHTLQEASRSSPKIIDLANYLVTWTNSPDSPTVLQTALTLQHIKPAGNNPPNSQSEINFVRVLGDLEAEIEEITDRAIQALQERPHHSIAILVLSNAEGNNVLEVLRRKGIKPNDLLRYNRADKEWLLTIFYITKFLTSPTEITFLIDVLASVLARQNISAAQIDLITQKIGSFYPEQLLYCGAGESIFLPVIPNLEPQVREATLDILQLLRQWLDQASLPWSDMLRLIMQQLQPSPNELDIGNYLIAQLQKCFSPRLFVDWGELSYEISLVTDRPLSNLPKEIQGYKPEPGTITVLTAHRAKGLEWDEVFLINCSAYQFPVLVGDRNSPFDLEREILYQWQQVEKQQTREDFEAITWQELVEERARLLYVAITRAKKYLTLSVATNRYGKEQTSSLLFDQLEEFARNGNCKIEGTAHP